jgi:hypothetical protein
MVGIFLRTLFIIHARIYKIIEDIFMHYSRTLKGLTGAGFWIISISFIHDLTATELTIPASLQAPTAMSAPPYKPVVIPRPKKLTVNNWTEVNKRVHEVGGWMFYASEGTNEDDVSPKVEPEPNKHKGH